MDLLKRELEKKRLALASAKAAASVASSSAQQQQQQQSAATTNNNKQRYIKASDLRRHQEQAEDDRVIAKTLADKASRKRERSSDSSNEHESSLGATNGSMKQLKTKQTKHGDSTATTLAISMTDESIVDKYTPLELTVQLRQLGLPIRLFGEAVGDDADHSRLDRLRKALAQQHQQLASMTEQNEFRLGHGHGIRNPFLERGDEAADEPKQEQISRTDVKAATEQEEEDISNDPSKRIHRYFKGLLKQWEDDLVERPEDEKRSIAGRNDTKTYKQCKDYIRPLFRLCKKRQLEENIVGQLIKIIEFCEQEEFVRANDAYMDLAIGRAAWPIGVTMVGIHARSGREKIASGNVAHVMNSELQRKYLTSVKRLMTFAQKKSNAEPSKKVSM